MAVFFFCSSCMSSCIRVHEVFDTASCSVFILPFIGKMTARYENIQGAHIYLSLTCFVISLGV